jgi:hypothetical protein
MDSNLLSALIGALVGGIVSFLIWREQMHEQRRLLGAQLLLAFDERLGNERLRKVHEALRGEQPDWDPGASHPPEGIEWSDVDMYLGAFERLNIFVKDGFVKKDTAKSLYGYRLARIVRNDAIVEKLTGPDEDWCNFLQLCETLEIADAPRPDQNTRCIQKD